MTAHIDPGSDRPKFKQLAGILRTQIDTGQLAGGDELPSKQQLADTYGVSINTVEGALRELKTAGLIVTDRGRRTRVRPIVLDTRRRALAGQSNYAPDQDSSFAREHGVPWRDFELTRVYETVPAPGRVAQALGLAEDAPVVRRRWTHTVEGVPRRISWSYLDPAKFGDTILCDENEPPWPGGTIAQLTALGHRVELEPPTQVLVRRATDEELAFFAAPEGTRVLESFRTYYEQGMYPNSWAALECAVHVYVEGSVTLAFNSLEGRHWNAGD